MRPSVRSRAGAVLAVALASPAADSEVDGAQALLVFQDNPARHVPDDDMDELARRPAAALSAGR